MNLDKIQIKASIRTGWQALDLGFLMGSAWWKTLLVASAIPAMFVFFVTLLIFYDNPVIAVLILWWLKPLFEKLPLFYGSRRLFDVKEPITNFKTSIRSILFKDLFPWLLWRRFSPTRAFDMPVNVLEQLTGKERSRRLQILHGKFSDAAFSNQFICFIFELMVGFGLFMLIGFLIPESLERLLSIDENWSLIGKWLMAFCAFLAMLMVMPFHTMAGFSLYLNRRIELEAWDIEINFRKLAGRIQQKQSGIVPAIFCLLILSPAICVDNSYATENSVAIVLDQQQSRELIKEVLDGEDYGVDKTIKQWRFKNWFEEIEKVEDDKIPDWFIDFIEWLAEVFDTEDYLDGLKTTAGILKLLLIIGFVIIIIYLLRKFQGPLRQFISRKPVEEGPTVMFGFDVTPESIPQNVVEQVLADCQENRYREAVGLLYRASLSRLIEQHKLKFRYSYTESECAQLVIGTGVVSLGQFFSDLTDTWKRLAYGHVVPDFATVEALCLSWSKELEGNLQK